MTLCAQRLLKRALESERFRDMYKEEKIMEGMRSQTCHWYRRANVEWCLVVLLLKETRHEKLRDVSRKCYVSEVTCKCNI